ncbi:hypothetical protein ACOSQ2_027274 [Xanthoceras sorbifolium]
MVRYTGRSPGSYKLAKDWQEQADIARSYLDKATRKMKKWADKKRRRVEFQVGDLVLVKLLPQQFKAFRKVHKGLVRKYEGPFPILKKVGKVSYKVELPPRLKIHPVFHVSHLKPYHADTEDPSRRESSRAPTTVVTSYDKEVEEILADRVVRKRGVPRSSEYLIKWKGLPTSEATWEPKEALWQFAKQIEDRQAHLSPPRMFKSRVSSILHVEIYLSKPSQINSVSVAIYIIQFNLHIQNSLFSDLYLFSFVKEREQISQ